jgi:Xaa-Pro dipeptidase
MSQTRISRLQAELRRYQIDCAVFIPGANLRYLTGLHMKPTQRLTLAFVPQEGKPALLLPLLELPLAEKYLKITAQLRTWRDEEGPERALREILEDLGLLGKTLALEVRQMRVFELRHLERHASGCRITEVEDAITPLRMIKDESEIASLRKAISLTEQILQKTIDAIRPGMSERETAAIYQIELLQAGGEGLSFAPIVVSGPNSASPHAWPEERTLQPGDILTLDVGATWNGYPGDITRNVALGQLDPELERIHGIVQEANAAGREACWPGALAQDVDRAARDVIDRAGYGEYFLHRTGHGLGLDVHEPPQIMAGNTQELQPGMTFTVEPGIYLRGKGGVRIEDNMLITPTGAETLTRYPRELIRL